MWMISFGADLTQLTATVQPLYKLLGSAFSAQGRAEVRHRSGKWPPAMCPQQAASSRLTLTSLCTLQRYSYSCSEDHQKADQWAVPLPVSGAFSALAESLACWGHLIFSHLLSSYNPHIYQLTWAAQCENNSWDEDPLKVENGSQNWSTDQCLLVNWKSPGLLQQLLQSWIIVGEKK